MLRYFAAMPDCPGMPFVRIASGVDRDVLSGESWSRDSNKHGVSDFSRDLLCGQGCRADVASKITTGCLNFSASGRCVLLCCQFPPFPVGLRPGVGCDAVANDAQQDGADNGHGKKRSGTSNENSKLFCQCCRFVAGISS